MSIMAKAMINDTSYLCARVEESDCEYRGENGFVHTVKREYA